MCFGHLNHCVDYCAGIRSVHRTAEQPVFSPHCERTDRILTEIIGKAAPPVFQIGFRYITPVENIIHGFIQPGIPDGLLLVKPRPESLQNRFFLLETQLFPLFIITGILFVNGVFHGKQLFKGLKVEKVVVPLPEEDQICPVCGTQMVLIGEEYVRRELEFIPATCKVIEYYSQSYGCPSCKEGLGDTEKPVIVKSQVPPALLGKGPASASAAAWTMYQKYANGLPLYRQEKDWKQYGVQISRTTLANWIIYCSKNYFQPMYAYFISVLLLNKK